MTAKLIDIEIDDSGLPPATPEMAQERAVALFDLMEENTFRYLGGDGPYRLRLAAESRRLTFALQSSERSDIGAFTLSLSPLRQVVKDYHQICASYVDAVKSAPPAQIESFDSARRAIHDEGAKELQERLAEHAEVDLDTARRLFTLVCVLQPEA